VGHEVLRFAQDDNLIFYSEAGVAALWLNR
jgi:hypothetical protein